MFTLVVIMLSLLLACAAPQEPPTQRTLRLVVSTPIEVLDPRFVTGAVNGRLSELVAPSLVGIGADLRPVPRLAASFAYIDPQTLEVTLREDAVFHDGTKITADDIQFTFESLQDPEFHSPHRERFSAIADLRIMSARTIRFILQKPSPGFVVDLRAIGILSKNACSRTGAPRCRTHPVGAGAFRVDDSAVDPLHVRLVKVAHASDVKFDVIDIRVQPDNNARLLSFVRGDVDVVLADALPADVDAIERSTDAQVLRAAGVGLSYIAFNTSHAALSDVRVRRALALALDLDLIVETKLRGRAERATGLLPPQHADKTLPRDAVIPFDPAQAEALLDEAGFPRGPDGVRLRLQFVTTPERLRKSLAHLYQDAWRQIGVDVDVVIRDWSALYDDMQRGQFQMFSAKWTPVVDAQLLAWVFGKDHIPSATHAGGNRSRFVDDTIEAMLPQLDTTPVTDEDRLRRRDAIDTIERTVQAQLPLLPLWFDDELWIVHPRVRGLGLDAIGSYWPLLSVTLDDNRRLERR